MSFKFVVWKEEYSVGHHELDGHHQKMLEIINTLYETAIAGAPAEELSRAIHEIEAYAEYHFMEEEAALSEAGYARVENQKRAHQAFVLKFNVHRRSAFAGSGALSQDLLQFLKEWWLNHILKMDRDYASLFATENRTGN